MTAGAADARVSRSTSTPRAASPSANARMDTFMPPASPLPAAAAGEVCIDTIATLPGMLDMLPLYSVRLRLRRIGSCG